MAGVSRNAGSLFDDFFTLARYNAGGGLDTSFGAGGVVATKLAASGNVANAVVVQADGKIDVAGTVHGNAAVAQFLSK